MSGQWGGGPAREPVYQGSYQPVPMPSASLRNMAPVPVSSSYVPTPSYVATPSYVQSPSYAQSPSYVQSPNYAQSNSYVASPSVVAPTMAAIPESIAYIQQPSQVLAPVQYAPAPEPEVRFPFRKEGFETCVCGNVFNTEAKFCRMCGRARGDPGEKLPLTYAAPPDVSMTSVDEESSFEEPRIRKRGNKKQMLIAIASIICCLLLCLGILLYFLLRGGADVEAKAPTPVTRDEGIYDYVIVGGGAAGMVLAERLSSLGLSGGVKIALLEGGGATNVGVVGNEKAPGNRAWEAAALATGKVAPTIYEVPGDYENAAWSDNYTWNTAYAFQGKGLGGSAAVNKMLFVRPTQIQLEQTWDPKYVAKLSQSFDALEKDFTYTTTPSMDGKPYAADTANLVKKAIGGAGYQWVEDTNAVAKQPLGNRVKTAGIPPQMVTSGLRQNSATVYGPRIRTRPNIDVILNAEVVRLKLNKYGRALWVEYIHRAGAQPAPGEVRLKSTGKVVMAAGALNTPRILLLSGIGPTPDVRAYATRQKTLINAPANEWRNNPYVGSGLQDHVVAVMGFKEAPRTTPDWKPARMFDPEAANEEERKSYLVNKTGPYAQYGPTLIGYFQSNETLPLSQADMQVVVHPHGLTVSKPVQFFETCNGGSNPICTLLPTDDKHRPTGFINKWDDNSFAVTVTVLKTSSKAKVLLDDDMRVQYPTFQDATYAPRSALYFQDPVDRKKMEFGIDSIYKVMTTIQEPLNFIPQLPTAAENIRKAVDSWETSHLPASHYSGSCVVGSCLEQDFRVFNTSNIFVGDASAMPQIPVQPVATVMAVARMISEYVWSAYVKCDVDFHAVGNMCQEGELTYSPR